MSTPEEHLARRLAHNHGWLDDDSDWEHKRADLRRDYLELARETLVVLGGPTEAQQEAARLAAEVRELTRQRDRYRDAWQAACRGRRRARKETCPMATDWQTPCANRRYTAHFGILVDPWNLDQCTECEFCGSCVAHICYRDDASTLLHLDHFKDFANPGEPECGSIGGPKHLPEYEPRPCNLPAGHGGKQHRARMGWHWPVVREEQPS